MFGRLYRSDGIPEAARARAVAWTRESNAARAAGMGPAGSTAGAAGSEEADGDLFAGKEAGSGAHEPSGVALEVADRRPPNDEVTTVTTTRPSHSERGVRAVIRNKRAREQMSSRRGPATTPKAPIPTRPGCRQRTPTSYRVCGSRTEGASAGSDGKRQESRVLYLPRENDRAVLSGGGRFAGANELASTEGLVAGHDPGPDRRPFPSEQDRPLLGRPHRVVELTKGLLWLSPRPNEVPDPITVGAISASPGGGVRRPRNSPVLGKAWGDPEPIPDLPGQRFPLAREKVDADPPVHASNVSAFPADHLCRDQSAQDLGDGTLRHRECL